MSGMTPAAPPPPPYGPPPGYKLKKRKRFYQRPFLFWLPILVIVVIIIVATTTSGSGSSGTNSPAATNPTSGTSNAPSPGVSRGLGTKDASADVKIGKLKVDQFGLGSVTIAVTNHSSKRSNYVIDVAVESADRSQQYDTGTALVDNLESGQTTRTKASFLELPKHLPSTAKVVLQTVQRNEAF